MSLRFIYGPSQMNKNQYCFDEIKDALIREPVGPPIFYIVPDQMTFQREYALFSDDELPGSIRAQVVSFSRIAWRVLQEVGGSTRAFISSIGVQMMLRKIIVERESDFRVFQSASEKYGFLKELEGLIKEFKRYEITPERLRVHMDEIQSFVHKEEGESALTIKLDDLHYLYDRLTKTLADTYIDNEDQLTLLKEKISETDLFDGAQIYFDGFHGFTPQELSVVEALMKKSKRTTVILTVDDVHKDRTELDLFYQPLETYEQLKQVAHEQMIQVEEHFLREDLYNNFLNNEAFLHLEKYFDTLPSPEYAKNERVPIKLAEAVHPRAEIEGVAQEILRLVREENYRYRHMAIFVRDDNKYNDLIATIFKDYQIPVFIDKKRTMLNHQFVEFIRSLFEVVERDWRYDAVFRLLKTGIIPSSNEEYPLDLEAIDELENYVIEYGIHSRNKWFSSEKWTYQRYYGLEKAVQTDEERRIEERLNSYREQITEHLREFDEQVRQAGTVKEFCLILYHLFESLQIPRYLAREKEVLEKAGELEAAKEQEQVWDALIDLMDELVEISGEETSDLSLFRSMLEAGLESLEFSHVPPSLDHVIVGTIDHSRMSGIKCSFLLGVNEGFWPMKPAHEGIINDQERELLAIHGMQLAESNKRKLLDDWFYMYLAFTSATDYLFVSYLLSDEEGESRLPSQLVKRLKDLFPTLEEPILLHDLDDYIDPNRFVTTPFKTRSALTAQLSREQRGYPIAEEWYYVLNWYIKNEAANSIVADTLQSLLYENKPVSLSKETTQSFFEKQIKSSVSQIETFYECSYKHFSRYHLNLQERKTFKLAAPDIGQLFHEALKTIAEWLHGEGSDFSSLTKESAETYARRAVTKLSPVLQHQILTSSNRHHYIQKKLLDVISRATFILSEQARQTGFSPVGIELSFGPGKQLQPLRLGLPNGYELILQGRIDRVDKADKEDELYLRIIDYKSSNRKLDIVEIYYGLALQMLAYLDVVLSQSEGWLGKRATPSGMFYFHVHNAMISSDKTFQDTALEKEILKQYKMGGLILSDPKVAKIMDESLESGWSDIYPFGLTKKGTFYDKSSSISEKSLNDLQAYVRQLMVRAGLQMTNGEIELNPYEFKDRNPCTFCDYRSLCQFDESLEENQYRTLKPIEENKILEEISKEGDES